MSLVKKDRFWIHGLAAGATAGVLAQVLVMRLNPEVAQPLSGIVIGVVLWASWGALIAGLPVVLLQMLIRQVGLGAKPWPAPELTVAVYLVFTALGWVNADLHLYLLSATARRVVLQDAVAWFLGALLAVVIGIVIRSRNSGPAWKIAFALIALAIVGGVVGYFVAQSQ